MPLFFLFFVLLLSLLSCFLSFCPLCLCCLLLVLLHCLCGSLGVVVVSFSLSDVQTRRKGAKCFCVLSCSVVGCFIWSRLYIPRTRQVSARLYRNRVLEKGNPTACSKLFCARLCSYLCSSRFVFLLFSYLVRLVGFCFLSPFRLLFRFNP